MSKWHKTTRNGNPQKPPAGNRGIPRAAIIVLVLAVAVALGYWSWKSRRPETPLNVPAQTQAVATNPPTAPAAAKTDFQKLKGKWLRPDGGYVIEIKSVDDSGKLDASYSNPRPIHVAKAEASQDGATTKVFIELRDVNYPGSTYTLVYEPQSDQLQGIYFQAIQRQNFEVIFERMK